jgi:hypothetical protein
MLFFGISQANYVQYDCFFVTEGLVGILQTQVRPGTQHTGLGENEADHKKRGMYHSWEARRDGNA